MKLKELLFLIILFIACTNSEIDNSTELATDSQRNWCYGIVVDIKVKGLQGNPELVNLSQQYRVALSLYSNETGITKQFTLDTFQQQLADKTSEGMRTVSYTHLTLPTKRIV